MSWIKNILKKKDNELNKDKNIISPFKLILYRFFQHRLAFISLIIIILIYFVALFANFIIPYDPFAHSIRYKYAPPNYPHIIDKEGHFRFPFVYDIKKTVDMKTMKLTYKEIQSKRYPIKLFVRSYKYKMLGLFETNIHLFGIEGDARWHLLGTDRMGRDVLSRIMYGARISCSIGLIGITISLLVGITVGGISGYYGGIIDVFIQRVIEFLRSIPKLPLWMALSAALPPGWPLLKIYFSITIILSLLGWTTMARVVRGKFMALRQEDFVVAARYCGASSSRIIFRHMLPSFLSHIIASVSLAIPGMIIGETALSFLGVGLRPPVISWGVLLQEAQNLQSIAKAPWLLLPGVAVIITVLSFNFLGDGIRDAADPYSS